MQLALVLQILKQFAPPAWKVKRFLLRLVAIFGAVWLLRFIRIWLKRYGLKKKRIKKRRERERSIAAVAAKVKADQTVESRKDIICQMPAADLVQQIKDGKLTAVEVLSAFQAKALDAHQATNCVVEFLPEAEAAAIKCDNSDVKDGLLFGLPISLKDHFALKGHDVVAGASALIGKPFPEDCVLVKILKSHGAIPFVRTDCSQLMVSFECSNPVYGVTCHPHDPTRCPGGSSGGEAALQGYGASPLGLGSDIGGSIRMPASMCGVCGFMATFQRMSKMGMPKFFKGYTALRDTYGPLAPNVDAVVLAMRALWDGHNVTMDTKIASMPFNNEIFESKKPLRIGYYISNGVFRPVPAVERAVELAKSALEKRGHTLVPWTPPKAKESYFFQLRILLADRLKGCTDLLTYDKVDPSCKSLMRDARRCKCLIKLHALLKNLQNPQAARAIRTAAGLNSVSEMYDVIDELMDYQDEFGRAWEQHNLDAVIGPVFPYPALTLNSTAGVPNYKIHVQSAAFTYTVLYNILMCPAGVVPVTKVEEQDIQNMMGYPEDNPIYAAVKQGMEGSEGLPVCVQCIALPYHDEMALRVMKEVEMAIQTQ